METRRLVWLMALVFPIILLVQYFELPHGYVLSNLLSFGKSEVSSIPTRGASNDTESMGMNKIMAPEKARENGYKPPESNYSSATASSNSSLDNLWLRNVFPATSNINEEKNPNIITPRVSLPLPPLDSPNNITSPQYISVNRSTPFASPMGKDAVLKNGLIGRNISNPATTIKTPTKKRRFKGPPAVVIPISTMNDMLIQSRVSYKSTKPHWPSKVDQELFSAKAQIENTPMMEKDPHVYVDLYRNFSAFIRYIFINFISYLFKLVTKFLVIYRSYALMEQTLKIYIYAEGEKPIFHQSELSGIYASEGWFMKQLEENTHFVTKNPIKAHLFYLPFSSRLLEETLYVPNSHSHKNLVQYLSSYLHNITTKYRFWNRTGGADHFLVACHDWAPSETSRIMRNCIRSLCNADVKGGGFQFTKDVSLPETYIHSPQNLLKDLGGEPPSKRQILAFFAGNMHGYLRPILLNQWENKDPDLKIFGKLRDVKGQMTYIEYMKSSKYCISAKGYEVYSPRVMEAIFYECVPVIISDNYVPPFFETLNWESFAVFVLEKDIPDLKKILLSIPEERYLEMQQRVKQVQKHFLWHSRPEKYDIFHMILHSIWDTRVSQMRPE
ncbi:hypothetical protein RD792_001689 [Penstemon davidsonii]|uniref:Exostosin GT47 domain-containing protein n=1 Tax=Penstemon davidsonii TaxID=160366 RepID=A0ABR0DP15_9LAMI|nr:hypothetical protein RD792_001689 [Penstemon davidsonii]